MNSVPPTDNPWKKRRKGPQQFMPPSRALFAQKGDNKATATWCLMGKFWKCTSASKYLRWMIGCTDTKFMPAQLRERGFQWWHWIEPNAGTVLPEPF